MLTSHQQEVIERLANDLRSIAVDVRSPPPAFARSATFEGVAVDAKSVAVDGINGKRPLSHVIARIVTDLFSIHTRFDTFAADTTATQHAIKDEAARIAASCDDSIKSLSGTVQEHIREKEEVQRTQIQALERDLRAAQGQLDSCVLGLDEARAERESLRSSFERTVMDQDADLRKMIKELQQEQAAVRELLSRSLSVMDQRSDDLESRVAMVDAAHKQAAIGLFRQRVTGDLRRWYFRQFRRIVEFSRKRRQKRHLCDTLIQRFARWRERNAYWALQEYARLRHKQRTQLRIEEARRRHVKALLLTMDGARRRNVFRQWRLWFMGKISLRKERASGLLKAASILQQTVRKCSLGFWFSLLALNRRQKREGRLRARRSECVQMLTQKGSRMRAFHKLKRWRKLRQHHKRKLQSVQQLFADSTVVLRRTYFGTLLRWRAMLVKKRRMRGIASHLLSGTESLRKRFWYMKWKEARQADVQRKIRVRLAGLLETRLPKQIRKEYFARLADYRLARRGWQREARRKLNVAERLGAKANQYSARYYFCRWRDRAQRIVLCRVAGKVEVLQVRTDTMWTQLEYSQRTVGNTNTCVQRLVDRLVVVDDSLDRLDKNKASRRELQAFVDNTALIEAPEHLRPPPTLPLHPVQIASVAQDDLDPKRIPALTVSGWSGLDGVCAPPGPPPMRDASGRWDRSMVSKGGDPLSLSPVRPERGAHKSTLR
eukprot:Hpha_TRINITY_DN16667_c1_g5::TRINITY_DN16667_c1_g5_i1::g.178841::m.178841